MGHEVACSLYKKTEFTKSQAIERFIESHSGNRDFHCTNEKSYKECYVSNINNEKEAYESFEKVLSQRYFTENGSFASVMLPDKSVFKSLKYLKIQEKITTLSNSISLIIKEHNEKSKILKSMKCKTCKHKQSMVGSLSTCEKCFVSLLSNGSTKKINKLNEKIQLLRQSNIDYVNSYKKSEYWIVGIEYHV